MARGMVSEGNQTSTCDLSGFRSAMTPWRRHDTSQQSAVILLYGAMSSIINNTMEDWAENRPLEKICEPDENDVLFSREDSSRFLTPPHDGNDAFFQLIQDHAAEYQTKSQLEKPMVALDILHQWRNNRGGRFLKFDEKTRLWNDVGDKKARQRIAKALKSQCIEDDNDSSSEGENNNNSTVSDKSETVVAAASVEEPLKTPPGTEQARLSRRISTKLNYAREGELYGRKDQREELLNVYHQVKTRSKRQFVVISGELGSGKTALARSLRQTVEQDGGFFLEAKFEETGQESAAILVMALSDFCSQLLKRDEATIERYRSSIQTAVKEEARILVSLIPNLKRLVGSDYGNAGIAIVDGVQASQAAKRNKYVFQTFLGSIASRENPIVLLLDDIHFANKSSLQVLTALVSEINGVLFVLTSRNDESSASRDVNDTLKKLVNREDVALHQIQLTNLDEDTIRFMLSESLMLDSENLKTIAQLIHSVTKGNVLFIMELLRSLQDEDLLQFDETSMQWNCDSHMIQAAVDAKSVNDLYKYKIGELPPQVQETLKLASCFGSRLDPCLLRLLVGENVQSCLSLATARGLLARDESTGTFVFSHEGIQQASYNLIAEVSKRSFHLKIGRKLTRKLDDKALESHLFVVARQLMLGDSSVTENEEVAVLASLYLRAGEKAVEQSNFETALLYLRHAVNMINDDLWKSNYDLTLGLCNAAAEVFYCTANFDDVESMVSSILWNARTFEETLRARAIQVYTLSSRNRQPDAIQIGLETLEKLGEDLPSFPSGAQVAFSMWKVKRLLRGMTDTSLLRLPVMKVSRKVAAMQMLNLIWLAALYSRPLLAAAVAVRMVKLTVTYGKCPITCVGFGFYAMLLCSGGTNINEGYRYGRLSLEMYDEFKNEAWLCRVSAAFYGCICTWKEPVSKTIKPLDHAYRVGLGTGDIEFAVLCASMNCWNNSGRYPLTRLVKEIRSLAEQFEFLGQETAVLFLRPLWQMSQNFMGLAKGNPKVLTGRIMDQDALTAEVAETCPGLIVWIRCYCMILAFMFGDFDTAESFSNTAHEIYDHSYGAMDAAFILFFETMALLAQAQHGKRGRVAAIRKRLKRLRHWSKFSPLNFLGKQYLVEAELAIVTGDHLAVLSKYTSSILLSREEGFLMQEALANERAGKYFFDRGDETTALPFLREACRLYEEWGGQEKVRHLREELDALQISLPIIGP